MAIYTTDLEALIFISIIGVFLIGINQLFSILLRKIKKVTNEQKVKISFIIRIFSIFLIVFLVIEGFPSFNQLDPTFSAVLTGSISTALAFATSEIFENIMSGLLIFIIDPFDIGHIIKVDEHKGIIRSITLTKVIMETFDNIIIEIFNSDIVSSKIVNYTLDLEGVKNYVQFKDKILSPQNKGKACLDLDFDDNYKDNEDEIMALYDATKVQKKSLIHNFTFRMQIPFEGFRVKIDKINRLCQNYTEIFGIKPQFHIIEFGGYISLKFRILTLNSEKLLSYHSKFTKDLYYIINKIDE